MKEFLESVVRLVEPLPQCLITQGPTDSGVDILLSSSNPRMRIGFQIRGYNDHERDDYNVRTVADVTKSGALDLDRYFIVFATDPKRHEKKIACLIGDLLKSQARYVRFIEPHQLAPLASRDNWVNMRASGLSIFLGPLDQGNAVPEPIASDNEAIGSIMMRGFAGIADSTVSKLYDQAAVEAKARNCPEAERLLLEAQDIAPAIPSIANGLACIALLKHDWAGGIAHCKKALELRQNYPSALLNMSVAMRKLGCFSESLRLAKQAYELDASDPEAIAAYAKALRVNGKLDDVRALLSPLQATSSSLGEKLLLELGAALLEGSDFNGALSCYVRYTKLFPQSPKGPWGAGLALARGGNLAEAAIQLEKATALDPDDSELWFALGKIQYERRNVDEALVSFSKAEKLRPDAIGIRGNLANVLRDSGKLLEALERYDSIVTQLPFDPIIWDARGLCLCLLGRYVEGLASFETGIGLGFKTAAIVNNAAECCIRLKQLDKAEAYLKEAISLGDAGGHAHANMGRLFTMKGQLAAARQHYEAAAKLGRRTPDVLTELAQCMIETSDYDQAEIVLTEALAANSRHAGAHAIKGTLHEARGQFQAARQAFKTAIEIEPMISVALEGLQRVRRATK